MAPVFNIESIVEKPTWKSILLELIETEKLDPWNIDLVEISDGFLRKIREMEKLDLLVPANIILAASILLKHKSNYIRMEDEVEQPMEVPEEPLDMEFDTVPQLTISSRIPPKRQITLDELMDEMESIIKYENKERGKVKIDGMQELVNLHLDEVDIEKKMDEVLENIKKNTDKEGWALFSRILRESDNVEIITTLLSVLHLTQKELIQIRQDKIFGEIFIHYENGKKKN